MRWPIRLCGTTEFCQPVTLGGERYLFNEAGRLYSVAALRAFAANFPRRIVAYNQHPGAGIFNFEVGRVTGPAHWDAENLAICAFFEPLGQAVQARLERQWLRGELAEVGLSMMTSGYMPTIEVAGRPYRAMREIWRVESVDFVEKPYMGGRFLRPTRAQAARLAERAVETGALDDAETRRCLEQRLAELRLRPARVRDQLGGGVRSRVARTRTTQAN